jgi:protein O-GlcNAc transferase
VSAHIEAAFAEAVRLHQADDISQAEAGYRRVLELNPAHAPALTNLGVIAARRGDLVAATQLYQDALAVNPGQLDAHFNLGNLLRKLGKPVDAAAAYQAVIRIDPTHPRAHLNLGLAVSDTGDWPTAIDCFRRAVALDPTFGDTYNLLGDALYRTSRTAEAVDVFREFVARCPDDARGHHNLGLALAGLGAYEDAVPELELAVKLRPEYPDACNSLGVALEALGRADEAQAHYHRAVSLRENFPDAWNNLGTSFTEQGRIPDAIEALTRAQNYRLDPRTGSNLLLAHSYSSKSDANDLFHAHADWAARHADHLLPAAPARIADPSPDRRLKIGYVSADFRQHTVSGFIEKLLTHHDRNRFHISCFANVTRADETTDRLRRLADAWRPIAALSDSQVAEQIAADEIDILVDLNGHTAGNRLLVFARKPAPIQMTLFGYPSTTGLKAIDYKVSDPVADPPSESGEQYAETVLRLPEVAWVYRPPDAAPRPNALQGLSGRSFTFGCLNNPAKLSDACAAAWAGILKAVAKSRLVLLGGRSASAARVLTDRFTQLGIASDRIEVSYRLPPAEYFEAYQPIDLALDPFPYNGGVTTCDALWMGVPVLTVTGTDYRSRQGASILTNLGLPEFVADSAEKLVDLATSWADQRAGLADLRDSLRDMLKESPLTDAARYVGHLEAAYRDVWRSRLNEPEA